jgi:hypothetical protein
MQSRHKSHLVLEGWVVNVNSKDGALPLCDDGGVIFSGEFVTAADFVATVIAPVKSVLKDSNGKGILYRQIQDMLRKADRKIRAKI